MSVIPPSAEAWTVSVRVEGPSCCEVELERVHAWLVYQPGDREAVTLMPVAADGCFLPSSPRRPVTAFYGEPTFDSAARACERRVTHDLLALIDDLRNHRGCAYIRDGAEVRHPLSDLLRGEGAWRLPPAMATHFRDEHSDGLRAACYDRPCEELDIAIADVDATAAALHALRSQPGAGFVGEAIREALDGRPYQHSEGPTNEPRRGTA